MRIPRWLLVVALILVLAGYVFLAVREARDREAARPSPAPIGATVDPREPLQPSLLADGGFDFAAVRWTPDTKAQAASTVQRLRLESDVPYAFFLNSGQAGEAFATLAKEYPRKGWFRFHGKPLVYVFGAGTVPAQPRFSVVRIDNGPAGNQYWVSDPPNFKDGFLTLTPGFASGGVRIPRSAETLDQQTLFAETNRDRTKLLLWQSWNVRTDRSALAPGLVKGAADAYDRAKAFNERWKRP